MLPFYFQLPDNAKCVQSISDCDAHLGMMLLDDPQLRTGWQLAVGKWVALEHRERTIAESLLDNCMKCCVHEMSETFLEFALWKALTKTALEACSQRGPESARLYLDYADELILSRALPVRLPRVGDIPILSRWIREILRPLQEYWSQILCPECNSRATEPGVIQLRNITMTSEGTIKGQITCTHCKTVWDEVTLLSHCHSCGHYPLIIGKNRLHTCGGLVCGENHKGEALPGLQAVQLPTRATHG